MEKSRVQHAMTYAVFLGIFLLIKFYVSVVFDKNIIAQSISTALMLVIPYLIFFIQRKYRQEYCNGLISYKEALLFGLYLFFFASLILGLGQYIFYQFINPDYLSNAFNQSLQIIEKTGFGEQIIDEAIKQGVPSPIATTFQGIVLNTLIGFLLALITSAFVKTQLNTNE